MITDQTAATCALRVPARLRAPGARAANAIVSASGLGHERLILPAVVQARAAPALRKAFAGPLAASALVLFPFDAHAAEPLPLAELAKPGRVLMLRHANAPGTGDPPSF